MYVQISCHIRRAYEPFVELFLGRLNIIVTVLPTIPVALIEYISC